MARGRRSRGPERCVRNETAALSYSQGEPSPASGTRVAPYADCGSVDPAASICSEPEDESPASAARASQPSAGSARSAKAGQKVETRPAPDTSVGYDDDFDVSLAMEKGRLLGGYFGVFNWKALLNFLGGGGSPLQRSRFRAQPLSSSSRLHSDLYRPFMICDIVPFFILAHCCDCTARPAIHTPLHTPSHQSRY